jgi:hypothetical protein
VSFNPGNNITNNDTNIFGWVSAGFRLVFGWFSAGFPDSISNHHHHHRSTL